MVSTSFAISERMRGMTYPTRFWRPGQCFSPGGRPPWLLMTFELEWRGQGWSWWKLRRDNSPGDADTLSVARRMHASDIDYSISDDPALRSIRVWAEALLPTGYSQPTMERSRDSKDQDRPSPGRRGTSLAQDLGSRIPWQPCWTSSGCRRPRTLPPNLPSQSPSLGVRLASELEGTPSLSAFLLIFSPSDVSLNKILSHLISFWWRILRGLRITHFLSLKQLI